VNFLKITKFEQILKNQNYAKLSKQEKDDEELRSELYQQIGQLKVELDWLKKKSQMLR